MGLMRKKTENACTIHVNVLYLHIFLSAIYV